jgi:hypothetical protein
VSDELTKGYVKSDEGITDNFTYIEDTTAFEMNGKIYLLTTDNFGGNTGITGAGILWESQDRGRTFKMADAKIGYGVMEDYLAIPPYATNPYIGYPKFERPAVLMTKGENKSVAYLYAASGKNIHGHPSAINYVLRVNNTPRTTQEESFVKSDLSGMTDALFQFPSVTTVSSESLLRPDLKVWYDSPARVPSWPDGTLDGTTASLIGNGHLGATVFGGVSNETVLINLNSLWSGGPGSALGSDGLRNAAATNQTQLNLIRQKLQNDALEYERTGLYSPLSWDTEQALRNYTTGNPANLGVYQELSLLRLGVNPLTDLAHVIKNIQTNAGSVGQGDESIDKLFDENPSTKAVRVRRNTTTSRLTEET